MDFTKQQFDYEITLFTSFKGVTFCNFKLGEEGQKCYYFLISDEEVLNQFCLRMQGSFILSNKKPTNKNPFCCKKINDYEVMIIDFYECSHVWSN